MRKLAPLKSLYSFVAVVETGSMSDAANVLNVSHSAVSQAIKSLENQLGKPLFQRVGRQVVPNALGRKYYRSVAPALESIVSATESIIQPAQSSHLTLNMINSLAMHWWIPRVSDFQQYAPSVDIRVSNIVGRFDLVEQGVDVALIHGKPEDWQDYHCEKLGDDELVLVCSPELIEDVSSLALADIISGYPTITVANERRKNDWQTWCDASGLPLPKQQKNLSFNISIQAVHAAIRKLGVIVTHRLFVKDDISLGLLTELSPPVINPHQEFYFVCQKSELQNEHVLQLRTWLKSEFNNIKDGATKTS
ncbi:LysR substrate-binding domain-containing protein [Vibrio paucivorans]